MLKWIQLHFIPSEANDHQPHFLRLRISLGLFTIIVLLEATYLLGTTYILPKSANFAAIFSAVLVDQTNSERNADSLGTLIPNSKLEVAARLKAEDMASKGYFAHNSPDGKTPWYWFEKAGYDYAAAGENLAVNFTDSKDVTEAWMRSPSHRANILNGNYTEIGIATARGTYKGKDAIFVVQEFGRQSVIARQVGNASSTINSLAQMITGISNPITAKVILTTNASPTKPMITPTPVVPTVKQVVTAQNPRTEQKMPTTTTVAGAETQKLSVPDNLFTETQTPIVIEPTILEKVIASPHYVTTMIYVSIFVMLVIVLGLAISIKIRIQYPPLIINGILVLVVITSIIMLNTLFRGVI